MNSSQYEELVSLLQDITARLERLEQRFGEATPQPAPVAVSNDGPPEGAVADARDLDGPYGNPEIRRDPPRWTGPSFVGRRFSDATPEYLESLAGFLDWKARESDKKGELAKGGTPKSKFVRLDASRARGWAKRNREGGQNRAAPRPAPSPTRERETIPMEYEADMPF